MSFWAESPEHAEPARGEVCPVEERKNNFNGSAWYLRKIDQMTRQALNSQDREFELIHANDTDEQLLDYVRARSDELGYAPHMFEVTGSSMISVRFGCWRNVLENLGWSHPNGATDLVKSKRYRDEYVRQQKLYRAQRQAKAERRMMRKKKTAEAAADSPAEQEENE